MAKTKERNRKLLSCSSNFYVLKLIIFILVLFISINGDNGEKVHSKGGNGVSTVNVSTTSYQLFNGEFVAANGTFTASSEAATTAFYADATIAAADDDDDDTGAVHKKNNHTGHGADTTEAHHNFIANENRNAKVVDGADADKAAAANGRRTKRTGRNKRRNNGNGERVLSRRRRYLIFPEGSSLQVGTYHTIYTCAIAKV